MKSKDENASQKQQAAKEYVESQLNILRKHGAAEVSPSSRKYKQIVRQVERASAP